MSAHPDDLAALIRRLRDLCTEFDAATARAAFEKRAAELGLSSDQRARVEALVFFGKGNQFGDVSIGDIAGRDVLKGHIAVGVNLGTIIYGRTPEEDERRRLVWYLEGLAAKLVHLPLRGLDERLSRGQSLELPRVYVALATTHRVEVARGPASQLRAYFQNDDPRRPLKREFDPDHALPDAALYRRDAGSADAIVLERALTAVEALRRHRRLILLGAPGSGKSTFLRYLAWALARRELDPERAPPLAGGDDRALLPILVPLRALAGRIARDGNSNTTVYAALRDELHACCTHQVDDALSAALSRGAALLLFDGLDETPLAGAPGVADRLTTLQAVRAITRRYPACPAVVTCRVRAFTKEVHAELNWPVETLAPFTLGQMRHFVPAWHRELVARGQIDQAQAEGLSARLIAAIEDPARPRLRQMAETPLLLTMMALVLYNRGELPRDRPQLYERILDLLLGQWDLVRDGQSLGQAIGKPEWDSSYIRPLLDRLSYQAHARATSADGRGRLARGDVYTALIDFFQQARVSGPGDAALNCLDYFEQRSGLLVADERDSFVFAHLTLQEHCAGREIALNTDDPVALIMRHRDDDRWREPIFLGAGLAAPLVLDRLLGDLIEREEGGAPKPAARWYRDLILAAELGANRDWTYLRTRPQIRVDRWQRELKQGLATLLADRDQPLPLAERLRAGELLGDLGDPRFPVTMEQWRAELARRTATFGQPAGYWCYLPAGTYRIGGWDDDAAADVPLAAFWIARYPITVAQYKPFVAVGYGPEAERWWTPEGWEWKRSLQRTEPWSWGESGYNAPNQPVIGVTWYEAAAFCAWLSEQLGDALPAGYEVRLPTEAEWEAAAAWDGQGGRPPYPWGAAEPTPELAIYDASGLGRPAPVGCCPAGAAACGALDLAGNVWEWTASSYRGYPAGSGAPVKDFTPGSGDKPARGGSWWKDSTSVRCGARESDPFVIGGAIIDRGLRVCAAPRSHSSSAPLPALSLIHT
ncbi:MAG: SUMF1/EgtB/PvdO family nonheme iron enzyme, partial [Chloroflexaceae bacterium]|nr:SUMF1/EgtB/PvdO family nonheme iron enzyme [Chloroflexaceae bacterium]